jgi:hypothetical protein
MTRPAACLLAAVLAACIACNGKTATTHHATEPATKSVPTDDSTPTNPKFATDGSVTPTPAKAKDAPPVGLNTPVKVGDVEVIVKAVSVGKLTLQSDTGLKARRETGPYLIVNLSLRNLSETKKIDYAAWAADYPNEFEPVTAVVVDELGNSYKIIPKSGIDMAPGAVHGSAVIYPGKTITDVLLFQVPVDIATRLTLELSGQNVGAGMRMKFRFPAPK